MNNTPTNNEVTDEITRIAVTNTSAPNSSPAGAANGNGNEPAVSMPSITINNISPEAVDRGLVSFYRYLDRNPYKYSDNVGAQFFLAMYKESPEKTREFYERSAAYGYKIELNEFEERALQVANEKTNACDRIKDVCLPTAMKRAFNRRTMLRIAAIGGGAASLKIFGDVTARIFGRTLGNEIGADKFQEKLEELENPEDVKKLQAEMEEALKNSRLYIFLNNAQDHLKEWAVVYGGGLFAMGEIGGRINHVFSEINKKKDQLVGDLDRFCNFKLDRTPLNRVVSAAER